jgi:hypothetical protein
MEIEVAKGNLIERERERQTAIMEPGRTVKVAGKGGLRVTTFTEIERTSTNDCVKACASHGGDERS